MSFKTGPAADEMSQAEDLPQLDASSLVDGERLEAEVKDMYRHVARGEEAELHFEVGQGPGRAPRIPRASCWTRSPPRRWPRSREWGITSTSPRSSPARRCSTSARDRAPTSSARPCWWASRAASSGVDITDEQLDKAARLRDRDGFSQVELVEAHIEELPFEDASFDAVISNGVINLSPVKGRVFAEAARVLRPGGRLAIADIVSGRALKERTRRNVELWAACIAGAIPRSSYLEAIEAAGPPGRGGAQERLPLHL